MAQPTPTLTLYRGFPISKTYVWSPFVTKLEARLRFAGLSYTVAQGAPLKGPRGKIPYLTIKRYGGGGSSSREVEGEGSSPGVEGSSPGVDTETISDSTLISEKLVKDGVAEDLNKGLNPVERAQDLALRALLEDKLYFYQVGFRFFCFLFFFSRKERVEKKKSTLRTSLFAFLLRPFIPLLSTAQLIPPRAAPSRLWLQFPLSFLSSMPLPKSKSQPKHIIP